MTHQCGPDCKHGQVRISLSVAEQRKLVEAETGGPCFRMWVSKREWEKVQDLVDWTAYPIDSNTYAVWRKQADLDALLASKDQDVRYIGLEVQRRILPDYK